MGDTGSTGILIATEVTSCTSRARNEGTRLMGDYEMACVQSIQNKIQEYKIVVSRTISMLACMYNLLSARHGLGVGTSEVSGHSSFSSAGTRP